MCRLSVAGVSAPELAADKALFGGTVDQLFQVQQVGPVPEGKCLLVMQAPVGVDVGVRSRESYELPLDGGLHRAVDA